MNSWIGYTENAVLPIAMLTALFFNSFSIARHGRKDRIFRLLILETIAALVIDTVSWIFNGQSFSGVETILLWSNTLVFLITNTLSFTWIYYNLYTLYGSIRKIKRALIAAGIPLALSSAVIALNLKFDIFFTIVKNSDGTFEYKRTVWFVVQGVVIVLYLFLSIAVSLIHRHRETSSEIRRRCLYLAMFSIFPLVGGIIQMAFYGVVLMWQCVALSLLIIYVNISNQRISTDALTGLNNRGQFDKYIFTKCNEASQDKSLYLLMMDIDNFKKINDVYGHVSGDEALICVSNLLKRVLGPTGAFISRYGGDEFAIIIECDEEREVHSIIEQLNAALDTENSTEARSFKLSLSTGHARFGTKTTSTVNQLIAAADKHMYEEKSRHKKNELSGGTKADSSVR